MPIVARIHRPSEAARKQKAVWGNVLPLLPALFPILHDLARQYVSDRNLRQTSLGFSVRTNLPLVDRFLNIQDICLFEKAAPPEWEQLAGPKSVRHIQFHQDPIAKTKFAYTTTK